MDLLSSVFCLDRRCQSAVFRAESEHTGEPDQPARDAVSGARRAVPGARHYELQRQLGLEDQGLRPQEARCRLWQDPLAVLSAVLLQQVRLQDVRQGVPERGRHRKGLTHVPLLRHHERRLRLSAVVAFQTEGRRKTISCITSFQMLFHVLQY